MTYVSVEYQELRVIVMEVVVELYIAVDTKMLLASNEGHNSNVDLKTKHRLLAMS